MYSFLLMVLFLCSSAALGQVEWFSDKPRDFSALLADPREASLRVGYLRTGDKQSNLDLAFGGQLGLVRDENPERTLSVTVKGLVTARFGYGTHSFDYRNGDFIGGPSFTWRLSAQAIELYLFHQSSHLGDDALFYNEESYKNFSYEAARLLYSRHFTSAFRVYGGVSLKYRADPARLRGNWAGILGGDWHFTRSLPGLFVAFDLRSLEESNWSLNSSLVLGYELGDLEQIRYRQRFFLEVFNGNSPMGQFSQRREFYVFAGMGFTI